VAQDEDLDLLAGVSSGAQHDPATGAWSTSRRSGTAPPADHAGLSPTAAQQISGREPSFGHPQAVLSLADRLCVGLVADPAAVPDIAGLAAAIEQEAAELAVTAET
jgi:hypothetical protein